MDISEINSLDTDNTATKSLDSDNTKTSDELEAGDYQNKGKTLYALHHKVSKVSTTLGLVATFSAAALLGGAAISNSFLGTMPSVTSSEFTPGSNSLGYHLVIENKGKMALYLILSLGDTDLDSRELTPTGEYEGSFTGLSPHTSYTVGLQATNHVDFRKMILTYSFATLTE
jgi:hypothetical protein